LYLLQILSSHILVFSGILACIQGSATEAGCTSFYVVLC